MEGLRPWHADEAAAEVADQVDTPGPRRPDLVIPLDWARVKGENRDFLRALGTRPSHRNIFPSQGSGRQPTVRMPYARPHSDVAGPLVPLVAVQTEQRNYATGENERLQEPRLDMAWNADDLTGRGPFYSFLPNLDATAGPLVPHRPERCMDPPGPLVPCGTC